MTFFHDARDAIRDASLIAGAVGKPRAIGYVQGRGWRTYDPTQGAPAGAVPEFLVLGLGKLPLPLTEDACEVFRSVLRAEGVLRP